MHSVPIFFGFFIILNTIIPTCCTDILLLIMGVYEGLEILEAISSITPRNFNDPYEEISRLKYFTVVWSFLLSAVLFISATIWYYFNGTLLFVYLGIFLHLFTIIVDFLF